MAVSVLGFKLSDVEDPVSHRFKVRKPNLHELIKFPFLIQSLNPKPILEFRVAYFGKTEPLFFISVALAWRAEVLAAASFAVAAACVFCFCDQLSTLEYKLGITSEFWWLEFVTVAGLMNKFKAPLKVNRLSGTRTRKETDSRS
ncbi:hypothetical protein QL285_022238 [Trifolium repens]|nr:hypothetical protein QL285_022238 [Trifolium repens]